MKDPQYTRDEASLPTVEQQTAHANAYNRLNASFEGKVIWHTKKVDVVKDLDYIAYITRHNAV